MKKYSEIGVFQIGKYDICVFPGATYKCTREGYQTQDGSFFKGCKSEYNFEWFKNHFLSDMWVKTMFLDNRWADDEDILTYLIYAGSRRGNATLVLHNIGIRLTGNTSKLYMMDDENGLHWKLYNIDDLVDRRAHYSQDVNEYLDRIEDEVQRIGKGYDCNFRRYGENIHHINGANHFCFSLEGDKVHPLTVGGSRFCYSSDFTREEFIEKLPAILLTDEECNAAYRGIWNEMKK